MKRKIVAIAPHPDDETLGCGGTLLKHKKNGDEIYWVIVTNVFKSQLWTDEFVERRQNVINCVSKRYQFDKIFKLDFKATELKTDGIGKIIDAICEVLDEVTPDVIYVPFFGDIHTDHRVVFDAVASCTKSFRRPYIKKVAMYETLSETDFSVIPNSNFAPNLFVEITEQIEEKINILNLFETEIQLPPFPRSIENVYALATLRGCRSACRYSEAFQILYQKE